MRYIIAETQPQKTSVLCCRNTAALTFHIGSPAMHDKGIGKILFDFMWSINRRASLFVALNSVRIKGLDVPAKHSLFPPNGR